jgi:hypothetical protein
MFQEDKNIENFVVDFFLQICFKIKCAPFFSKIGKDLNIAD